MKPFLLLSIRSNDVAADDEYEAFLRFGGLEEGLLQRVRMDQVPLGRVELAEWSGVILGGGPFNASSSEKSEVQLRVEAEVSDLLDEVVERDFPFLGACYGVGTLGVHQGAVVDETHREEVGAIEVELTASGQTDPLLAGLPTKFTAFGGHKEAISRLPEHVTHLATSTACPVQAFKVRQNVYATQFHPELDVPGIQTRIEVYKHAGYFAPEEAEALKANAATHEVTHPTKIVRNFVERYQSP